MMACKNSGSENSANHMKNRTRFSVTEIDYHFALFSATRKVKYWPGTEQKINNYEILKMSKLSNEWPTEREGCKDGGKRECALASVRSSAHPRKSTPNFSVCLRSFDVQIRIIIAHIVSLKCFEHFWTDRARTKQRTRREWRKKTTHTHK